MKNKGVTLILVITLILVVAVLANIALVLVRSQFRLTHHQVNRIQGFYAAQAGVVYTLEMLRTGAWPSTGLPYTRRFCDGCTAANEVDEPDFPHSVQDVVVRVEDDNSDGILGIHATAAYAYTP